MGLKVEKLEGNMALLTIDASAEAFEAAVQSAYLKNRDKVQVQGFRKGKAPRALIEKMYGEGVFYEDAINQLIEETYFKELDASEEGKALSIVSRPEIDVKEYGKGKTFVYTAKVALKPEVKLGDYKECKVRRKTAKLEADELENELKRIQEQNSRTVTKEEGEIVNGDIAVIDYEGFTDGVAFEGGKGEDHELTIGSHSFIDTFEEQLIGHKTGDAVDVNVTFPTEYHAKELAGKPALFKVTVKAVKTKELPELNDEFASEVSDFETFETYKADVEKKLLDKKQTEINNARTEEIIKKVIECSEMDIPQPMIDMQAEQMVNEYAQRLQMQGLSMEMFMQYTGQTAETLKEQYKDQAKARIQSSLVLEAVAKAENIEVTDADVDAEIEKMAAAYQMEAAKLKEYIQGQELENMKADLKIQKAVELLSK